MKVGCSLQLWIEDQEWKLVWKMEWRTIFSKEQDGPGSQDRKITAILMVRSMLPVTEKIPAPLTAGSPPLNAQTL